MARLPPPRNKSQFFGGTRWINASVRSWNRERGDDDRDIIPDFNLWTVSLDSLRTLKFESQQLEARHTSLTNEARYLVEGYDKKWIEVQSKMLKILTACYKDVPPPHLRGQYASVISVVVTCVELFGYLIDETLLDDYLVPCDLIDKFSQFIPTLEKIKAQCCVELVHYFQVIDIRNAVLKNIRETFRGKKEPESRRTNKVPLKVCDRYSPVDYEWICGNLTSGPHHLVCVKYLCVARINQLNLTALRYDLVASQNGLSIDYCAHLKVPMPARPGDANLLSSALLPREAVLRELNSKTFSTLEDKFAEHPELLFSRRISELGNLLSDIRKKKKTVADLMQKSDRKVCAPYHMIIGVLATVEAQLLMVERTFALFMDNKWGMFGKVLPESIFLIGWKLLAMSTVENCKCASHNPNIDALLDEFRTKCRSFIASYFKEDEERLEKEFEHTLRVDIEEDENTFSFTIELDDFPDELQDQALLMIKHLYWEQFELERLNLQLSLVKRGYFDWPSETNTPKLEINTCTDGIIAFLCNFDRVFHPAVMFEVVRHVMPLRNRLASDYYVAFEIINMMNDVIEKTQTVPSLAELTHEFNTRFKNALGNRVIEDQNALSFSAQVTSILNSEITMNDLRSKFRNKKSTTATVRRIADSIVEKFVQYLDTHEAFLLHQAGLPKKRSEMVTRPPQISVGPSSSKCFLDALNNAETDAHMAMLLRSLTLGLTDGSIAAFANSVVHSNILDELLTEYDEVPKEIIDAFIACIDSVDLSVYLDLSAPMFNVPVD